MSRAPQISGQARANLREEMRQDYEVEGLTVKQLAAKYERSYGLTHQLLMEADTQMRPRGGSHGR